MNYVAISRDIWTDPDFPDEPMSQREAFMWLVAEAAWKPRKVRRANAVIALDRGELAHSIRFMADAWGWHRARVERFLKTLKNRDSIETRTETGVTVVTICNYAKYQGGEEAAETATDAQPRQHRDSTETNYNQDNQDKQVIPASPPVPNEVGVSNAALGEAFARFWAAYPETPNKGGKKVALGWFRVLVVDQGQDPEAVIGAAQRYASSNPEQKFIWSAWKFLRDEHWANFPALSQVDEPDVWRARIRHYEASGRWADGVGPKPGNPGCQAPAEIQREFGYDPRPLATDRRGAA